ncbi:helix-turn-helix transcriptional regulator [Dactylosporangium vinaceum]|uniref:Winged helix-turn-helix transcriptional regulator n=1 Tax=Dactylosporangium vinaceum TaxID=53362 RepID=A0ABV5M8L5_9ACTN|nr:helix-turn-helix domain-containing protein [Dactylosporangium vinaceum]UAB94579.1 helix-turn-helix transcriptional regulator [Dactylosporangium vinaceum]
MPAPLPPDLFDPACPSSVTPFQIGDKWAGLVLTCLRDGHPRRFNELRIPMRRVSAKVLAETLRALERDGMISRHAYAENPPRVEYTITDLGRTLLPAMDACREWARQHLAAVESARTAYEMRTS